MTTDASSSAAVAKRAEALGDRAIQLTQTLIRANTVNRHSGDAHPGTEANGQKILAPLLKELGARLDEFDCPPDVYTRMGVLGPRDRDFSDRPNLLSLIEYGAGGPTVVLQGHMDTVGVDDMTLDDPFAAEIKDGKLWGRGASDMKGGLAAVITALQALHDVRAQLKGRIVFASVVEEECNGSGAGALAWIDRAKRGELFGGAVRPDASGRVGDFAICTDGSGPEVWRGYGGVLTVDVHVQGKSGHPARPGNVSAIEKAILLKEGIDEYKAERESLGPGRNVNLGLFRGGTHPSVVAGSAVMSLNMSYVAADAYAAEKAGHGFGNAPGRARFEELVNARAQQDEWLREHPPRIDWIKDLIPFELPEDHPLVRDLAATHQAVLGQPASIGVNPAWSDACYLAPFAGTPAVVFGAGVAGQAHTAAEYNDPHRIVDCARVLAAFLYEKLAA